MIKHLDKLTVKYKDKYVIWILKNLKTVSRGIDSLSNNCVNCFNALKYFVYMRQGHLERDNGYIEQGRSAIENPILA